MHLPFKSLIPWYPPTIIIVDLIEISTLSKRSGNIQLINNSDKRDGNTLLLSSQSYRKKSKVTVSECIKPRNKKKKGSMLFLLLITSYKKKYE
nr:MAG TPA: hypothetical protein [Caudoviricetes sp.]